MVELNPKRYLSDEQCKPSAYHIAGEMGERRHIVGIR